MAKDPRAEALADSQAEAKRIFKEQQARQDTQPTPTQEENDRAKLGVESLSELDNKEADGSEEQNPNAPRKS